MICESPEQRGVSPNSPNNVHTPEQMELAQPCLAGRQAFPTSRNYHFPNSADSSPTDKGNSRSPSESPEHDGCHDHHERRRTSSKGSSVLSLFRGSTNSPKGSKGKRWQSSLHDKHTLLDCDSSSLSNGSSEGRDTPEHHIGGQYISEEWSNLLYQTPPKKTIIFRD